MNWQIALCFRGKLQITCRRSGAHLGNAGLGSFLPEKSSSGRLARHFEQVQSEAVAELRLAIGRIGSCPAYVAFFMRIKKPANPKADGSGHYSALAIALFPIVAICKSTSPQSLVICSESSSSMSSIAETILRSASSCDGAAAMRRALAIPSASVLRQQTCPMVGKSAISLSICHAKFPLSNCFGNSSKVQGPGVCADDVEDALDI
jgi:hypothetical protein